MYFPSLKIIQDVHFLPSICSFSAKFAKLQVRFMLAESYKYLNLCTDKKFAAS